MSNAQKKVSSFHSSVNCIPVLRPPSRRHLLRLPKGETKDPSSSFNLPEEITDFLRDSHPKSLDNLGTETYSGSFQLRIEAMTALIFGDQKKYDGSPTEISVPVDPTTGHPFIAPTMIKGMISNAYERLTASRFRIFGDHSVPLTYRADPSAALELVPIKLSGQYDQGDHRGTLLYGPDQASYAKLLTHEEIEADNNRQKKIRIPLLKNSPAWDKLSHGELVDFKAKKTEDSYIVTQVKARRDSTYLPLKVPDWVSKSTSDETEHSGWFYSTTPDGQLKEGETIFDSKLSERIFFDDQDNQSKVEIDPAVAETYDRIIRSYSYDSKDTTSKNPSRPSRFVIDRAGNEDIGPINHSGLLAYARLQGGKVVELMPTQVGRRNYSQSPRSLARVQGALPVACAHEASPADRAFGFIPKPSDQPKNHSSALRGRITISAVDTSGVTPKDEKLDLRPLLAPKTTSARRFLTDDTGSTISGRRRPGYYSEGDLLGAAAYPFRRRDADRRKNGDGRLTYSTLESYETERAQDSDGDRQKLNTSVCSFSKNWIKRGSVFHCTVHFEGLSQEELRTLLWVVDSERLGKYAQTAISNSNSTEKEEHGTLEGYLRMGMGKPLGLGVVHVSFSSLNIVKTATCAGSDAIGLVDDYIDLKGCLGAQDTESYELNHEWRQAFLKKAESFYEALSETPWCKAFLRSCVGYPGKVDVRYMTLQENRRNNQTNKGEVETGHSLAPRSLAGNDWSDALSI